MTRRLLIAALSLLVLPTCDAGAGLFGQKRDKRADRKENTSLPASRNVGKVPKSARQRPLGLEVGQWTRHVIFHSGGKTTEFFRQIVAREPEGFRLEIVNGQPDAGTVTQLLIAGPAPGNELPHVVSARVRMPNGIIKDIVGPAMDATRSGYLRLLTDVKLGTSWSGNQVDVRTAAGDFSGCSTSPLRAEFAGLEPVETAYYHPEVPIGGLVKAVASDGHTVVELTGYGTEGARSVIERRRASP